MIRPTSTFTASVDLTLASAFPMHVLQFDADDSDDLTGSSDSLNKSASKLGSDRLLIRVVPLRTRDITFDTIVFVQLRMLNNWVVVPSVKLLALMCPPTGGNKMVLALL